MPRRTSKAVVVTVTDACTTSVAAGRRSRRFWMPARISCLIPVDSLVALSSSELEVGTEPRASPIWLMARGTTSQRKRATRPARAA
jgi:hypothetical protein